MLIVLCFSSLDFCHIIIIHLNAIIVVDIAGTSLIQS